eukprot:CAMPEP_0114256994 /NCGR_PEP_ID=MMETSP0058-20121206/18476_1 /TAXON_ID=36894 /ORGANISM="Pyramimonas parkeae, CCMP726" /LENGTH=179 /DNA_ID=CAMNT_0001371651 /DNA_START=388 /DNA_END=924 /DNA_ORIENTATION=-
MGVGKLLELAVKRSAGGAAREVQERISAAASGRGTRVNWEDYNYPPYIRVVHYDDNDIEVPGQRAAVKWAHVCYILTTTSLLLNVAANIVLLCAGATDFVNCVYAFFNLVIVAVVGMYGFYHGYKGLATGNSRMTSRYLLVQIAVMIFMLLSSLLGVSNFNGWLNLKRAKDASHLSGFW